MFKLSKLTDYAVMITAALDECGRQECVSVATLGAQTGLPEPTVSKALKLLSKAGIAESVRGAAGGYKIARPLDEISVLDVIVAMEGPFSIVACVDTREVQAEAGLDAAEGDNCCAFESHCMMRGRWDPVNSALKTALGGVSVKQMMGVPGCGKALFEQIFSDPAALQAAK